MEAQKQIKEGEGKEEHSFKNLTHGKLDFQEPIPLKGDLEFRNLNLFTGYNGSGKSFINKFIYFAGLFLNSKIIMAEQGILFDKLQNITLAQFYIDGIFDSPDMTGTMCFYQDSEAYISVKATFVYGKITELDYTFPEGCKSIGKVLYMTKETRTFNQLESYMRVKDLLGITKVETEKDFVTLFKMYRLHDIMAFEQAIIKMEKLALEFNAKVAAEESKPESERDYEPFKLIKDLGILELGYDKVKQMGTYKDKVTISERFFTQLSAGDQSLMMIMLQNLY